MSLSRRHFLKVGAAVSGGLAVGFQLTGCSEPGFFPHKRQDAFQPNAFLQLSPSGHFILQLHRAEMGQGVYTGVATLAAEELGIEPEQLTIEHAEYHPDFDDPEMHGMITGGSSSIRNGYLPVRHAAAAMALVLRQAASQLGAVNPGDKSLPALVEGHKNAGRMNEWLALASKLPSPETVTLKPSNEFELIGRYDKRLDARDKITGKSQFSLDAPMDNAAVAVLLRCPHIGGSLIRFDASDAESSVGVIKILEVDGAVAVIAKGYWFARQAAGKVLIDWDKGPLAGQSSESLLQERQRLLREEAGRKVEEVGSVELATGEALTSAYEVPYLAHAAMEPLNALAYVTENRAEIWTGNQAPDIALGAVAHATGLRVEQVRLHNQMLGGGFGRKTFPDYIVEAARVSQLSGLPVRLIWSREDDTRHDTYRPNASAQLSATIESGRVTSIQSKVAVPSIFSSFLPVFTQAKMPSWVPAKVHRSIAKFAADYDEAATEGLTKSPYQLPYKRCDFVVQEASLPVGYWRSVGHSQNAFFMESFVDELAEKCAQDPVAFRLSLLPESSKQAQALRKVAEMAKWGEFAEGQFKGVAVHESFETVVAEVVTVRKTDSGVVLEDIYCVIDCGQIINPDTVRAQVESGVIFGLTAALKGQIDVQDGAVVQSNFHDYPVLRMSETPDIHVYIMPSEAPPTGVGEPATPPLAPALANALYAATGLRQRSLPLSLV